MLVNRKGMDKRAAWHYLAGKPVTVIVPAAGVPETISAASTFRLICLPSAMPGASMNLYVTQLTAHTKVTVTDAPTRNCAEVDRIWA